MAEFPELLDFGVCASLQKFYDQTKFIDVVLVSAIDLIQIPAHRMVLRACSSFFEEKFAALEQSKSFELIVVIDNLLGETLKTIIDCFYNGTLDINLDNVDNLLAAGKVLNLANIIKACEVYIESNLNAENCIQLHALTIRHDLQQMQEKLKNYICNNFIDVYNKETFLDIDKDSLSELLKSDNLKINTEADVLNALLKWLQHDESRGEHIPNLISHIRVEHLSPTYLADHMDIFDSFPQLQGLLQRVFLHQYASDKNLLQASRQPQRGVAKTEAPPGVTSITTNISNTNNQSEGTLIVIEAESGTKERPIYSYSPRENECTCLMQSTTTRSDSSICTVNDNASRQPQRGVAKTEAPPGVTSITTNVSNTNNQSEATFIIIEAAFAKGQIYSYCPRENKWTSLMQSTVTRKWFAVCTVNDNELIIAGGQIGRKPTNEVVAISLRTKTIRTLNSMNKCRVCHKLVVLDNCIYAIGGKSGGARLKTVERLVQNGGVWSSWSYVADMNEERRECAVATLDGLMYVTGGAGDTVECYNPKSNEWRRCAPMNTYRYGHEVAALNNFLYAVGGYNKLSMEKYDPRIDKWTKVCDLSIERWCFACVALNGRLIIAGGRGTDSVTEYNPELNVWTNKASLPIKNFISGALVKNI